MKARSLNKLLGALGATLLIGGVTLQSATQVQAAKVSTAEYAHKDKKLSKVSKTQLSNDKHNMLYHKSPQYIKTTNGYLTTDSTFRPAYIHKAGKKWVRSGSKDYRSLLAYWWPNKTIQANYLKYMTKHGYASKKLSAKTAAKFTKNTSDAKLDAAAQAVRDVMEAKISKAKSTKKVNKTIQAFVNTQDIWGEKSEYPITDSLNNGYFLYNNNSGKSLKTGNTSYANSNWRLLNRSLHGQKNGGGEGEEFLLADDIDNSNPTVQSEDLNWEYFLQKFGTITQHNSKANFDTVRVDAVDDVDTDTLQISDNLMEALYKVSKTEKNANDHLTINEDWSTTYGSASYYNDHNNSELAIDTGFFNSVKKLLTGSTTMSLKYFTGDTKNGGVSKTLTSASSNGSESTSETASDSAMYAIVNRVKDNTYNQAMPNYSFVRAHDAITQDVLSQIVADQHKKVKDPMRSQYKSSYLKQAFKTYYSEFSKATKKYAPYNVPSGYALLLTNKDMVPRVYYGDLYQENVTYMSKQTRYYKPITTMLSLRKYTVAGGQAMHTNTKGDILTSVRFGTGIADVDSAATTVGRNQGSAVVISNNPKLKSQTVSIQMGKAHANQEYTMAIGTTSTGLSYNSGTYKTDNDGVLKLKIKGYAKNPDVRGYLAYLVPKNLNKKVTTIVAANSKGRTKGTNDNKILHSNAALDSHVILEGFSNFQPMPKKKSQYTNVILASSKVQKNLKAWGITDFEFGPQYKSVKSKEFLDSILQNGYAFTDRYDLGFSGATKYGTAKDLAKAIVAMHKSGLKVMADYVPDQVYDLNGKQVVTATRVGRYGEYVSASKLKNILYLTKSVGGGKYQAMYGGKFLKELKQKYPAMFAVKQISTGKTLPVNTKITQWSAKYLNGTGLQRTGAYRVFKDGLTKQYFYARYKKNKAFKKSFLPMSLLAAGYAHNGSLGVTTKMKKTGRSGAIKIYHYTSKKIIHIKNAGKGTKIPAKSGKLTGVVRFGKHYIYYRNGRLIKSAKITINGKTYKINSKGYIVGFKETKKSKKKFTGVKKVGKHYRYYRNGRLVKNKRVKIGKRTYKVDKHGYIVGYHPSKKKFTGVKKVGKHYRYYRNGRLVKNKRVKIGKRTYKVDKHGYIVGYHK